MTTTIKITELTNIGANLASSTVIPVVNMAGTPTTEKTVLGNVANFILAGAGGNYVAAAKATTATTANTVLTNAQPNITSVGNLTGLTVSNASGVVNFSNTANVTLGAIANLRITGGSNGQVLTTNGSGNLSWTTQTGGGGNANAAGSNTQIQFNDAGLFGGNSAFTFEKITGAMAVPGTLAVSNTITGTRLISNIATGTAPLTVTSTTQVANLNVATSGTAGTVTTNAQPNITSVGTLTSLTVTANITSGNVYANSGTVGASLLTGTLTTAAQPNITSVSTSFTNLTFANAQTISGNNMTLTTGANTNVGTITGNWSLSTGSQLRATYADLAEYYVADQHYESGTVLEFGGDKEVTIAEDSTARVAGIVSTNPAYVLNTACEGEHTVVLALQGRVPCKVRGNIKKGDMLISAGDGFARHALVPLIGTVIGKSLENFDGIEGIIEVAVGRL